MNQLTTTINLDKIKLFDDYKLIKTLINGGILNDQTKVGDDPLLSYAISKRKNYTVELLLRKSKDGVNRSVYGRTPLYIAAWKDNNDIIKLLLEMKADCDIVRESNGATALYKCVENNNINGVHLLIEAKANVNIELCDGASPLLISVQNGSKRCTEMLLDAKADVNRVSALDVTPLYMAAQSNSVQVMKLLLKHGANPDAVSKGRYYPISVAIVEDSADCMDILLEANADVTSDKGYLHVAAEYKSVKCMKKLAEMCKDNIDLLDESKCTPLHKAVEAGSPEIIDILIKAGADVNVVGRSNLTPLYNAVVGGDGDIVKLLLEGGADPNIPLLDSVIPVSTTILNKCFNNFKKIYDNVVDHDIMSSSINRSTPVYIATMRFNNSMLEMLLEAKGDPNNKLMDGKTPIFIAACMNNKECLNTLLKYHAKVDHNAYDVAVRNKYKECEKMLKLAIDAEKHAKLVSNIGDTCPICLDMIETMEDAVMTNCYHIFHVKCWGEYRKNKCPVCRNENAL